MYNLWVQIEEYDPNTDTYKDLEGEAMGGPYLIYSEGQLTKRRALEVLREIDPKQKPVRKETPREAAKRHMQLSKILDENGDR